MHAMHSSEARHAIEHSCTIRIPRLYWNIKPQNSRRNASCDSYSPARCSPPCFPEPTAILRTKCSKCVWCSLYRTSIGPENRRLAVRICFITAIDLLVWNAVSLSTLWCRMHIRVPVDYARYDLYACAVSHGRCAHSFGFRKDTAKTCARAAYLNLLIPLPPKTR